MGKNNNLKWEGKWIWISPEEKKVEEYIYFRKRFFVKKNVSEANLYITAERDYACWLNGKFVGRGPVLSDPRFKRYDIIRIENYLEDGENLLSVIVYHDGANIESHKMTPYAEYSGLLCQIEIIDDKESYITAASDSSFKVFSSKGYYNCGITFNDSFWPEFYNANLDPYGWKENDFDDSSWKNAVEVISEKEGLWGCYHSQSRFFPWINLIPRDIPYLEFVNLYPVSLAIGEVRQEREASAHDTAQRMTLEKIIPLQKASISGFENLISGKGSAVIMNSDPKEDEKSFDGIHNATIVFDFGEILNGRPCFTIECEGSAILDIGYSTRLKNGQLVSYVSYRTANADQYIARKGLQKWSSFNWRHFRYIQITFRNLAYPLYLRNFFVEKQNYPFKIRGKFICSNKILNKSFEMAEKTLKLSTTDRFMDNPSREAKQYLGDCSSPIPATLCLCGHDPILEKYFKQFNESQHDIGLYRNSAPGSDDDRSHSLIDHSLYFPLRLWEYYYHTGNSDLVSIFWNKMLLLMEFMERCLNERGLLENLSYSVWYDWADIDRRGEMLIINVLYAEVLKRMLDFSEKLDLPADRYKWNEIRENIQQHISDFFDPEMGVFVDCIVNGKRSKHASEHSNSVAILFGDIEKNQIKSVVKAYKEKPEIFGKISPIWSFWLPALVKAGEVDIAIDWIESRFGKLIKDNFSTIPETWSLYGEQTTGVWRPRNSRAEVQSGGVWIISFLLQNIVGIMPYKPGFKEVLLNPCIGKLEKIDATMSLKEGEINLSIENKKNILDIEFSLPSARRVFLNLSDYLWSSIAIGKHIFKNKCGLIDIGIQSENHIKLLKTR